MAEFLIEARGLHAYYGASHILHGVEFAILDEATEGLAPKIAKEIREIVRAVRASGIAAVIVDKNFAAVNAITDRNLILVKGEVVYAGPASDLRAKPEVHRKYLGV